MTRGISRRIVFRPDDIDLEFRWNGSLTINIYAGSKEIDVMTLSHDARSEADALAAIEAWLRDNG